MTTRIDPDIRYLLDENERLLKRIQKLEKENLKLREDLKKMDCNRVVKSD